MFGVRADPNDLRTVYRRRADMPIVEHRIYLRVRAIMGLEIWIVTASASCAWWAVSR
jgi:hypothetical protein